MSKLIKSIDYRDLMLESLIDHNFALPVKYDEDFSRIRQADDYISSNRFSHNQIVNMLVQKFQISRIKATTYVDDANYIFAHTRKIHKQTELFFLKEDIKKQIAQAREDNRQDLLPKLNDNLIKVLALLPDEESKRPPTQLVINVTKNDLNISLMPSKTAAEKLEQLVKVIDEQ